jgi:putative membrane protein
MMGGIVMLLFWVLIIGGVVWLIVAMTRTGVRLPGSACPGIASDILRRRHAAGEIAKEQYDEMKRNLGVDALRPARGHLKTGWPSGF